MKQLLCTVSSNVEVMSGVYLMWLEAPDIAAAAQTGQFITVRCGDLVLRRPFSIHRVGNNSVIASEATQSQVALLFRITGRGTLWLAQRKAGERIDALGPLGNGFTIGRKSKNLLLVAGGIGIAPLVYLMQQASPRYQITLIHGVSTAAQLYPFSSAIRKRTRPSPLPNGVQFIPVTEDGSMGHGGKATDVLPDYLDWADQVYACGPVGMYEAMAPTLNPSPLTCSQYDSSRRAGEGKEPVLSLSKDEGEKATVGEGLVPSRDLKLKKCQVSLEVRMGCGFGACYACTINTRKGLKRVCRDGPIFELGDIIWQEVGI